MTVRASGTNSANDGIPMNRSDAGDSLLTQDRFDAMAALACAPAPGADRLLLSVAAEASTFVRINHGQVRQATSVHQSVATLTAVTGQRRLSSTVTLPDSPGDAAHLLLDERRQLLDTLAMVPDDPHLRLPDAIACTHRDDLDGAQRASLPEPAALIDELIAASPGVDLAGFLASGPSIRAFADSRGQRNWHRVASFNLDWSCYADGTSRDRAVKTTLAGTSFSSARLRESALRAREQLALLQEPARTLEPGSYRVLLAPAAVNELLQAMAWTGFSHRDRETGTSSLSVLHNGARTLDPRIQLAEVPAEGLAPVFTDTGAIRPPRLTLIDAGRAADTLVSLRSAAEYGVPSNADGNEHPDSLQLSPGFLADTDMLAALDTGLLIGNLWYLNYSDRQNARVTGMSRFACFAVERGRIVAPINVMRFDASLFDMFGTSLEALGSRVEFMPGGSTWGARELSSVSCPAVLLRSLSFTL